jgi:hypothetical protein
MNNPDHIWVKILKYIAADPGWKKFGSGKISVICFKKFHLQVAKASYLYALFFSLSGGCGLWLFNGSPGRSMQRYDARTSAQTSGQTFQPCFGPPPGLGPDFIESVGLDQGVTKICRLSLLNNSALVIQVQMRGKGVSCVVSANEYSCAHHLTWSPNKLWISISIFSLWSGSRQVRMVMPYKESNKGFRRFEELSGLLETFLES